MGKTSTKSIRPVLGRLHTRQQPDVVPFGDCLVRNYFSTIDGTLARAHGYRRFLDRNSYCNQDLHDQLLTSQLYKEKSNGGCGSEVFSRDPLVSERITSLFPIKDSFGSRYLLAATNSRIYQLNETTGNWRLLADGLGRRGADMNNAGAIWRFAFLNDYVIAVNGEDRVMSYLLNDGNHGCELRAFKVVEDLVNVGVSRVRIAVSYRGTIMLMNAYSGGRPLPGLILWSQPNRPLVYDPLNQMAGSITSSWYLLTGHSILNATEFGGNLVIFTDKGIWNCAPTGSAEMPYEFASIYQSDGGHRCLAFPNTLVNTGDFILYVGRDDIYVMSATSFGPESIEWIRDASGMMMREINTGECDGHVAGWNPAAHEIWISYCLKGSNRPTKTLVLNYKYQTAYYRDEGFTAFATYQSDSRPSFRDFLTIICACQPDEMADLYEKEGIPCFNPQCNSAPTCVYTNQTITIDDPNDPDNPVVTEDWDAPYGSSNSVCAILGKAKPEDFCGDCNEETMFIGVLQDDNCIKDINPSVYSSEKCLIQGSTGRRVGMATETPTPQAGQYAVNGYNSEIIFGPLTFNDHRTEVNVRNVVLHIEALPQMNPCAVGVAVGVSSVPVDPNGQNCAIRWQPMEYRLLECVEKQHPTGELERPAFKLNIPVFVTGSYLYIRLAIEGLSQSRNLLSNKVPAIGGQTRIFSIEVDYQPRL